MTKISTYSKDGHYLLFNGDLVTIDIEVKVTKTHGEPERFELEIVKCQLSAEEAFSNYLVGLLNTEALLRVQAELKRLLEEELTPQLYSIYYDGVVNE